MEKKKISFNQATYGSVFKLIKYLGHLTKEPIVIEVEGVEQAYTPPERVVISNLFFRNLKCLSCGKCCTKPKFSLVYTASDYSRMLAQPLDDEQELKNREVLLQDMVNVPVTINLGGIFHYTSIHLFSNQGHKCHFLFEREKKHLCGIHQVHPNHCALPHLQIDQHKGISTSLLKRQYGRNWALGCPAIMEPFNYDAFLNWDLPCLRKLENNAKDLQINTWLPEIIKYLTENREQLKLKQPKNPVVIYDKKKGIPHSFLVKD